MERLSDTGPNRWNLRDAHDGVACAAAYLYAKGVYPNVRRARIESVSVQPLLVMPNGVRMRSTTYEGADNTVHTGEGLQQQNQRTLDKKGVLLSEFGEW